MLICLKKRTNTNYKTRRKKTFFLNGPESAEKSFYSSRWGEKIYTLKIK